MRPAACDKAMPRVFQVGGDPDPAAIAAAAEQLRRGGLVIFPTETVYGVGVDAGNPAAVDRLNRLKGRPPEKPYSLHVHARAQVEALVGPIPPAAERLMARYWPGPLTIILPARQGRSIGFRLPDHPVALAFLKACGVPVAAPSANRSGALPPTDAADAIAQLGHGVDAVIDGGPTPLGCESTVVEIVGAQVVVRRAGAIAAESIVSLTTSASGPGA